MVDLPPDHLPEKRNAWVYKSKLNNDRRQVYLYISEVDSSLLAVVKRADQKEAEIHHRCAGLYRHIVRIISTIPVGTETSDV